MQGKEAGCAGADVLQHWARRVSQDVYELSRV